MGQKSSKPQTCGNAVRNLQHSFKVIVLGEKSVGKTSLLRQYIDHQFTEDRSTTINVDIRPRVVEIEGERVKLQFWDTAGEEKFRTFTTSYFRKTDGAIIVYDVTDEKSFQSAKDWLRELEENCTAFQWVLVGNKSDNPKTVDSEVAQRFAEQKGAQLFETSAKNNVNVDDMICALAQKMLKAKKFVQEAQEETIRLTSSSQSSSSSGGCCG